MELRVALGPQHRHVHAPEALQGAKSVCEPWPQVPQACAVSGGHLDEGFAMDRRFITGLHEGQQAAMPRAKFAPCTSRSGRHSWPGYASAAASTPARPSRAPCSAPTGTPGCFSVTERSTNCERDTHLAHLLHTSRKLPHLQCVLLGRKPSGTACSAWSCIMARNHYDTCDASAQALTLQYASSMGKMSESRVW